LKIICAPDMVMFLWAKTVAKTRQECYARTELSMMKRRPNMKGWRVVGLALAVMLLFGCASKMNQVQIGMTRDQVVGAIGSPSSTSEMGGITYLKYQLCSDWIFTDRYYVRLTDDKVDAFGRVGDFNLGY
jgi:hypothetical protein